jgi:hypothetical protein
MALKETPAEVARLSLALSGPEPDNVIRAIVADLKQGYPQADNAELVNYVLTAYCPVVKIKSWLSNREKREMMDRFSTKVYDIVK